MERELEITDERSSFIDEYRNSNASTGSFTDAQLAEFTSAFELFDEDKDGMIAAEEMVHVLDSIGHSHTKEGELQSSAPHTRTHQASRVPNKTHPLY